jgi:hypothetical protein
LASSGGAEGVSAVCWPVCSSVGDIGWPSVADAPIMHANCVGVHRRAVSSRVERRPRACENTHA